MGGEGRWACLRVSESAPRARSKGAMPQSEVTTASAKAFSSHGMVTMRQPRKESACRAEVGARWRRGGGEVEARHAEMSRDGAEMEPR